MEIFVGNLSFDATKADIRTLFEGFGTVTSVVLLMKKNGVKSRGFCFVDMADETHAQAAIAGLHEKEFMGRPLKVMVARPKAEKSAEEVHEPPRENRGGHGAPRDDDRRAPRPGASKRFEGKRRYGGSGPQRGKRRFGRPAFRNDDNGSEYGGKKRVQPWKKEGGQAEPWAKKKFGFKKPWERPSEESPFEKRGRKKDYGAGRSGEGHSRPWQKKIGAKPWERPSEESRFEKRGSKKDYSAGRSGEGHSRPWQKKTGAKPWERPSEESRFEKRGSKKDYGAGRSGEGHSRPWQKKTGAKPWERPSEESRFEKRGSKKDYGAGRTGESHSRPWQKDRGMGKKKWGAGSGIRAEKPRGQTRGRRHGS